jgi:hypothetical protein
MTFGRGLGAVRAFSINIGPREGGGSWARTSCRAYLFKIGGPYSPSMLRLALQLYIFKKKKMRV